MTTFTKLTSQAVSKQLPTPKAHRVLSAREPGRFDLASLFDPPAPEVKPTTSSVGRKPPLAQAA